MAKRIHHQWLPDKIYHETGAIDSLTAEELGDLGYLLHDRGLIGSTQTIGRDPTTGELKAAPDKRRSGYAGWSIEITTK